MNGSVYRVLAIVLSAVVFGCAAPSTPATAPTAPPKAAPTAAASPAPTAAAKPAPTAAAKPAPTAAPAAKAKPSPSFAGRTVTILIGFAAGGDADITARQVAPFLAKYLPGNPTVVVQNMPGAGGLVADNWLYNVAPKDGTFIGQPSLLFTNALFSPEQTKYDLAKLHWLGGLADTNVLFARKELGIASGADLANARERLFVGMGTGFSNRDLPLIMFMRLLGVDHQNVTGYTGAGDQRAALMRNEIHITAASLISYDATVRPLVEQGQIVPLLQAGFLEGGKVVRDSRLNAVPTYAETLLQLKGDAIRATTEFRVIELSATLNGLMRGWIYPPGVPVETLATVVSAFEKVLTDPEWVQEYQKNIGHKPIALNAARSQEVANAIVDRFNGDTEAVELIRKLARES